MVPREPALPSRPPAAGVPQPGLGQAGPPRGNPASGTWTAPLPSRPARRPVVIPRPAPPRRRPVLWLSVLFVLLVVATVGSYLAITTPAGRAVRVGAEAYVADHWRLLLPVGIVGGLSWGVWAVRKLLSVLYRPTVNDFRTTTSVVVPSFREDPDVLDLALDTWLGQDPDQVIVVLDVADTEAQRRLVARKDPRLRVIMFKHAGKRSALGVGIRAARGEILVLTDSDTRWTEGLLTSVQMPFADPAVGGVSTRQSVYQADTSVWRRVAEWIINNRYLDYVPATGRAGAVVCVSGRTAAYRREIVLKVLPHLADHTRVAGLTVRGGQKGVMVDASSHVVVDGIAVTDVGEEAVHLRRGSSDNVVRRSVIRATGLRTKKFGEGIYVGSAKSNWCTYSGCLPDRSDRNVLEGNDIAETTAESVDVKEGTTGGTVRGNTFSGLGMSAADAWVDVKGNEWQIVGNVGADTPEDGFQTHRILDGWGARNTFADNRATVNGPGYAINVTKDEDGNRVACSNTAVAAAEGLSTIACS